MAIRHIWRWSTLYVIVELKIKTVRYHCTSIRIAQKQNTTPNTGKNRRRHELSFIADGNTKMTQPLWKIVWQFPTKLSILLKHDPAILLICIFPKWLKMYMHTKICIGMFITVLHSVRSVQSLSHVWLFGTPWIAACQASLSITNSQNPPKPMPIELVMPSSHLILCCPLLLLLSIVTSIRGFPMSQFFTSGDQTIGPLASASVPTIFWANNL